MQCYEVATLTFPVGVPGEALPRIEAAVAAMPDDGALLCCWISEIGALNQIMVLRGHADAATAALARERLLLDGNPFGVADLVTGMAIDAYAPFPFLPPIEPGSFGPVYEVRVYGLKPSGLAPTIEAWRTAVPARRRLSPLTIAMYATGGAAPRFMHIWPYAGLDERMRIRAEAVAQGVWPPVGGPVHLTTMTSTIFLPASFSPLR